MALAWKRVADNSNPSKPEKIYACAGSQTLTLANQDRLWWSMDPCVHNSVLVSHSLSFALGQYPR